MINYNILQLQDLMDKNELSSEELTKFYINRIIKYNKEYNAVLEVNTDALNEAKKLDEERMISGKKSLLHGIPVLLKDNINIENNKKLHTTAGSIVLKDLYSNYDAFIVKKLKEAGAVILGKANLSEFANFISDASPNGFSALGGQVKNPYGNFDVGGSSSGSGAAVALGLCQVAIGTETSGSIISPASSNSVVGVKPTVGLVSRYGIVPISWTQDIPGPLTRNVIDSAITLNIIRGKDVKDESTKYLDESRLPNYTEVLNKAAFNNARIGVPRAQFIEDLDEQTLKVYESALNSLKELGAELIDVEIKTESLNINWDVLYYEFPIALNEYLNTLGNLAPVTTLEEIVNFNKENINERVPYDQKVFEKSLEMQKDYGTKYSEELKNSVQYGKAIDKAIEENNLDVLVFANTAGADIAARAGYPSVTVPAGYTIEYKPVGLTFTSTSFTEDKLLSYAYSYESAYNKRKNPL